MVEVIGRVVCVDSRVRALLDAQNESHSSSAAGAVAASAVGVAAHIEKYDIISTRPAHQGSAYTQELTISLSFDRCRDHTDDRIEISQRRKPVHNLHIDQACAKKRIPGLFNWHIRGETRRCPETFNASKTASGGAPR